eukprot:gene28062-14472_t
MGKLEEVIAEIKANTIGEKIDLRRNKITDVGAKALVTMLEGNTTITF